MIQREILLKIILHSHHFWVLSSWIKVLSVQMKCTISQSLALLLWPVFKTFILNVPIAFLSFFLFFFFRLEALRWSLLSKWEGHIGKTEGDWANLLSVSCKIRFFTTGGESWKQHKASCWCEGWHLRCVTSLWRATVLSSAASIFCQVPAVVPASFFRWICENSD